ncbi:MAG: nitrilase-related carbon-nitrogen hydrolase, partial [Pseudomonadota bacterium]
MTRRVTVAAIQYAPGLSTDSFAEAEQLVREAAKKGAQVILLPELFEGPYFCKTQDEAHFAKAAPWENHPVVKHFAPLAKELKVVLPLSLFEQEGPHTYNSMVMVDADGTPLGVYRKSHIPDG